MAFAVEIQNADRTRRWLYGTWRRHETATRFRRHAQREIRRAGWPDDEFRVDVVVIDHADDFTAPIPPPLPMEQPHP